MQIKNKILNFGQILKVLWNLKNHAQYMFLAQLGGFVRVSKVRLELSKIPTHKIKKYPVLNKIQFLIDWDHF